MFSPISTYAFEYYKYKLAGTFYAKNGKLIDKIKLIPRRKNDRVFSGFIYIVEDYWAIYGTDVTVTGKQINNPIIDTLKLKQNYNYSKNNDSWMLISQTIDFKAGIFGFHFNGRFSSAYSNYNFNPNFNKNTFGNEILSFEKQATKKDSTYWKTLRPMSLTKEETNDYVLKDRIKTVRKSKKYLDSIDKNRNKFNFFNLLVGYSYKNSYKKWGVEFFSPLKELRFNTVQGWNTSLMGKYYKKLNEKGKIVSVEAKFNYGFSDKRLRSKGVFTYRWNAIDKPILQVSGGITTPQFNYRNPISAFYNTISSVFFERNYMKIYEKTFVNISYAKDIFNGVRLYSSLEFANRKPLNNTTNYSIFNIDNVEYTSNNLTNFAVSFRPHHIWIATVGATIHFGNKYLSYPNRRWNIKNTKYPALFVGYKKTFGSGNNKLNSDFIYAKVNQDISLGNWGTFTYNIRSGIFLEKKPIPFMDYAHPNGNRFFISPLYSNSTNHFNLLKYYQFSTNNAYTEMHAEQNFKGFLLGKIPLLNTLNFYLVAGAKGLFTSDKKPYTEYSIGLDNIGWGKWRFLRVDYIRSNFNGKTNDGFVVIGVNLLD